VGNFGGDGDEGHATTVVVHFVKGDGSLSSVRKYPWGLIA
jgi:hypothetical protein